MRASIASSSVGGQLVVARLHAASTTSSARSTVGSSCTSSERTPGVTSTIASPTCAASQLLEGVDPGPQGEVERHLAVLDEHERVAGAADR